MFIGLGLLSTAYALRLGGWLALLGLISNAFCFALAGKSLQASVRMAFQQPLTSMQGTKTCLYD